MIEVFGDASTIVELTEAASKQKVDLVPRDETAKGKSRPKNNAVTEPR